MTSGALRLSGVRTFLLVGLAIVWFGEGLMTGVRPLAEWWTQFWKMPPPADATLAATLYVTHAFEAPLKAALLVLALFALRSGSPSVRTPLFVAMSLVPPINVAFHFRAQGFPLMPTTIGVTLSALLWGSFFLTKEPADSPSSDRVSGRNTIGRAWFGVSAAALTFLGLLCLVAPETALYWLFPQLTSTFDARPGELTSLIISMLAAGSHLTALATASWLGMARYATNRTLRLAVASSSLVVSALMCALPLGQAFQRDGWISMSSPIFLSFVTLLAGWAAYTLFSRTQGDL